MDAVAPTGSSPLAGPFTDLPPLTGRLSADRTALREHTARGEEVIVALPPVAERNDVQRAAAGSVHANNRLLRQRFLRAHASAVYDELTAHRTHHPRCAELVTAAGEAFPGLVPDAGQRAAEAARQQSDREGREIDQGIFFSELLRVPETGDHLIDTMLRPTKRAEDLLAEFRRTDALDLGAVLIERHGPAAHLTITNGYCLNAEDNAHVAAMETAVDLALLDPEVRVGVLRGGVMDHPAYRDRRVFSAGINLAHLHEGRISFVDFLLLREIGYINKLLRGILVDEHVAWPQRTITKPWVAAVDSFAIGGGAQLLMVFDRVVAAADSYVSLPAAQEGIIPGAANFRLGRLSHGRLSRQVILWGRRIWAHEPDAGYLLDEVVDPREMDAAVENSLDRLDSPAVVSNRHILNLAEEPPARFREYLAEFSYQQVLRAYSPDVLGKVRRFTSRQGVS